MKDTYIEAIDCLAKIDNIDYRDIIFYIAKNHPRVLIKACQDEMPLTPHEKVVRYVKEHPNQKIKAIKYCRKVMGLDIEDGQKYVENIISFIE